MQGLPKSWQHWLIIFAAFSAPPLIDVLAHWMSDDPSGWTWQHALKSVVGGAISGFLGWLLPELRKTAGLPLPAPEERKP